MGFAECDLASALNRVLADDVVAPNAVPPFTASAMDGFAVNSTAIARASEQKPVKLEVAGAVETGQAPPALPSAQVAMRIMTGGALPTGADCVVPFEATNEYEPNADTAHCVKIFTAIQKGQFIRKAGGDTQKGEKVLSRGTDLTPADIGLLASLGIAKVTVYNRPQVAVLSTGNELVEVGTSLKSGQIYDANTHAISSAITAHNGVVSVARQVKDTTADIESAFDAASASDMIVSTGGVSAGDHDLIQDVLRKRGEVVFWKVNLKPGKPTLFGMLNAHHKKIPFIGLPGNPVSALVGFHLFIRPAMRLMQGLTAGELPRIKAQLTDSIANADGREAYFRGNVFPNGKNLRVVPSHNQFSNALKALAHADALIFCPSGVTALEKGASVEVILLDVPEHWHAILM